MKLKGKWRDTKNAGNPHKHWVLRFQKASWQRFDNNFRLFINKELTDFCYKVC